MKKTLFMRLISVALICVSLVACAGSTSANGEAGGHGMNGRSSAEVEITQIGEIQKVQLGNEFDWIAGVISDGAVFYSIGSKDNKTLMVTLALDGKIIERKQLEIPSETCSFPWRVGSNPEGGVYVLFGNETEGEDGFVMGKYGFDGKLSDHIALPEMDSVFFGPCIGNDGTCIFWNPLGLICYDRNGKFMGTYSPEVEDIQSVICVDNQYFVYFDDSTGGDFSIRKFNIKDQSIDDEAIAVNAAFDSYMQASSTTKHAYIDTGNDLVLIDPEFTIKPLFTWSEIGVGDREVDTFTNTDQNDVFACTQYDKTEVLIIPIERKTVERSVIMIGAMRDRSRNIEKYVGYFNNNSDKYYAKIKYYDDHTLLTAELIAGKTLDVLEVSSTGTPITETYFKDIAPCLSSNTTDHVTIPESLYNAMCTNGKLLSLFDSFEINTIVGRTDVVGNRTGWSMQDLSDLKKQHGEGYSVFPEWMTSKELMLWICSVSIGQFIDWNEYSCDFENEEFIKLLKFCAESPETFNESTYTWDYDEHVLLTVQSIQSAERLDILRRNYGNSAYTFIGFPNNSGSNGSYFSISGEAISLAIPESTDKVDGALEFVTGLLSDEWQSRVTSLPVGRNELNRRFEGILALEDQNITNEDVEAFNELLDSTTLLMRYDRTVSEIILEEAQSMFMGDKSAEETARIINVRVGTYLAEQR